MFSCVFVEGIEEETVRTENLNFDLLTLTSTDVNYNQRTVTACVFGLNAKTAYYNDNTGCTLINKINPQEIYRYKKEWKIAKHDSLENWFNYIDTVEYLSTTQLSNLDKILNSAFVEEGTNIHKKNTRAALVLYKGQLVAEQYAEEFSKDSRLMGWSMTKSITATMFSMIAQEKKLT